MRAIVRSGIEPLAHDESLCLLGTDDTGRLGLVVREIPVVLPVNYAVDGDAILIRVAADTALDDGRPRPGCLEIDSLDRAQRAGWSILVTGRLEEITAEDASGAERRLRLVPWAGGEDARWMRLVPDHVAGRRVAPVWSDWGGSGAGGTLGLADRGVPSYERHEDPIRSAGWQFLRVHRGPSRPSRSASAASRATPSDAPPATSSGRWAPT